MKATQLNSVILDDLDFIINSSIDWNKFRNKTVLITGSYGMLLSYMTLTLLRLNELYPGFNSTVIALVRSKEKAAKRFGHFIGSESLQLFQHDLASPVNISNSIDFIVHGASYASPHHFAANPIAVLMPNIMGTYHLLELARSKGPECFLYFSSGAVYGAPIEGEEVTEQYYGYVNPLDIRNCYGESKRMAENMCRCWFSEFGIPVTIVRPAHVYGPTMDIENDSRVFAGFVNNIVRGRDIVLKSDGSARRSFCYIADATVAFFKVILDGAGGEAYNVGNDAAYMSIRELAEIFVSTFPEKQLKVVFENPKDGADGAAKGDRMLMSSRKVEALGWNCAFALRDGLGRTVESFSNQVAFEILSGEVIQV